MTMENNQKEDRIVQLREKALQADVPRQSIQEIYQYIGCLEMALYHATLLNPNPRLQAWMNELKYTRGLQLAAYELSEQDH